MNKCYLVYDGIKLKLTVARFNGSSFLLNITQYEMPFINKSEATKRSKDRKINGKCTNATNRKSRAWPVYLIHHHYCRERRRSPEPTPVRSLSIVLLAGLGWVS